MTTTINEKILNNLVNLFTEDNVNKDKIRNKLRDVLTNDLLKDSICNSYTLKNVKCKRKKKKDELYCGIHLKEKQQLKEYLLKNKILITSNDKNKEENNLNENMVSIIEPNPIVNLINTQLDESADEEKTTNLDSEEESNSEEEINESEDEDEDEENENIDYNDYENIDYNDYENCIKESPKISKKKFIILTKNICGNINSNDNELDYDLDYDL